MITNCDSQLMCISRAESICCRRIQWLFHQQQFGGAGRGIGCEKIHSIQTKKWVPTNFIGMMAHRRTIPFSGNPIWISRTKTMVLLRERCGPWIVLTILYALRDLVYCILIPNLPLFRSVFFFLCSSKIFSNYLLEIRVRNLCALWWKPVTYGVY